VTHKLRNLALRLIKSGRLWWRHYNTAIVGVHPVHWWIWNAPNSCQQLEQAADKLVSTQHLKLRKFKEQLCNIHTPIYELLSKYDFFPKQNNNIWNVTIILF